MILGVMFLREDNSKGIQLKLDTLNDIFSKLRNHRTGNVAEILPFIASRSRPLIRGRFYQVFGEYVRNICKLNLKKPKGKMNEVHSYLDELYHSLLEEINFQSSEDKNNFLRFIKSFLFNENTIKPIHPYLYNYMTTEKTYQNEMSKYGEFLYDILIGSDQDMKRIFNNKNTEDLLTEIILSKMDFVRPVTSNKKSTYQNLLPVLSKIYKEDVLYLSNHKSYFLTSFPLLTHFYVFMYTCQLILKFEQYTSADFNKLNLFYFALDWESVSGRREAATGPGSFRVIKEQSANLFPHVHAMSHLSHNTSNKQTDDLFQFQTYPELFALATNDNPAVKRNFLKTINEWIVNYSQLEWIKNTVNVNSQNTSLEQAFKELQGALRQGMSKVARERYGAHVEHLGSGQFIKSRGSLGFVFNLTHEFILLLTAVSVKNKRIPLSNLFEEYERRGITLDWRSKNEIIQYLDNLNFIDKKSDSGDAQYVKPIL